MNTTTMNSKSIASAPASGLFALVRELFSATPLAIAIKALRA